jgi:RNA polymerase sigma-70 factor (ECF subfamily)
MNDPSDEDLYRHFRNGDAQAFESLYQRYRQPLFHFLLGSCRSVSDAEDLFQDLWDRIIHSKKGFTEGSFRAWIFRIARNLQIDAFRRSAVRPVSSDADVDALSAATPLPETRVHDEDCGQRMRQAIGQLSHEQREAFLLKEETGMPLGDIADMLCVGRETIKSRLRYALKRLRALLEDCL